MPNTKLPATERVVRYSPPSGGYFTIPSEERTLFLADKLIPPMTQDQAGGHTLEGGFHALSMLEHFDLIADMYALRNAGGDIEKARQFVRNAMGKSFPNTLTRLLYQPEGKDKIVHGYGTKSPIEKQANLVGPAGEIVEVLTPEASLALTGRSPEEVAELMQYINGTPTYVWRLTAKPESVDERVAGFDANPGGAVLFLNGYPRGSIPLLGVRREKL